MLIKDLLIALGIYRCVTNYPKFSSLKHYKGLLSYTVSVDQELGSSLAQWFDLRFFMRLQSRAAWNHVRDWLRLRIHFQDASLPGQEVPIPQQVNLSVRLAWVCSQHGGSSPLRKSDPGEQGEVACWFHRSSLFNVGVVYTKARLPRG